MLAMNTVVPWKRPGIRFPQPFDTILFDVDGVLINTAKSFRATDIAVAEYVVGTVHHLDWGQDAGRPLVTPEDVDAFKQAGGFNNDWDMCYLLASLFTARLREWRETPLAQRSIEEWAQVARAAHLEGHGGREWVDTVIPASARLAYNIVGILYYEYYWGATEVKKRFGRAPRLLPNAQGLMQHEEMLYTPDFPERVRAAGIRHLGMITGRVGEEVQSALERMESYSGERWWDVVISADICPKPHPRAMILALEAVGACGGLYIGDTADDHDLVRNYMQVKSPAMPEMLAAMLPKPYEVELYKARGADLIVGSVENLLAYLPEQTE